MVCPAARLDFHHAQTAAAVVLQFFVVAQRRDGDAGLLRRLQHGRSGRGCDFLAVNLQHHISHVASPPAALPAAILASYSSLK